MEGTEPVLFGKVYDYLVWLIPVVESFPRSYRFFLGDRIQRLAIELYELVIEAAYTKDRIEKLDRANLAVEKLRLFFRLCRDLKIIGNDKYRQASEMNDEIGRMIGGWKKHQSSRR